MGCGVLLEMKRLTLLVLVAACHGQPQSSAKVASVPQPLVSAPSWDDGELDYEGSFDGAKLHATLDHRASEVHGALFYDAYGARIAVSATFDGTTLVLHELEKGRPISTTMLARTAQGSFSGEWSKGDKRGAATLAPLTAPTVVVRHEKTHTRCEGERYDDGSIAPVKAIASLEIPVAMGLADRALERSLDDAFVSRARALVPKCPLGIEVTAHVVLEAHGFLGVVFSALYTADEHIGLYAYTHTSGTNASLIADLEGKRIFTTFDEVVSRKKIPASIVREVRDANALCVSVADDPLDLVTAFVPTTDGAEVCFDTCSNHAHSPMCSSAKKNVHQALKAPFTRLSD